MNTKKILITGGAGFIGSCLCETLIASGDHVTVMDNLSTGSKENIARFLDNPNFRFVQDTILNRDIMAELIEQCDMVYHLAAAVGVRLIVDDPVHTIETNIFGTEILLQLANQHKKPVFIASTSEVYGKSDRVPFKENDDTTYGSTQMPRWAYASSKAVDEFLALAYYKQYGLPVVVGRFFNTIGPRQTGQYGMVVPRFIDAAMKNEPIKIYGTGQQTRCFSYVQDVVKAMTALMENKNAYGDVFNIGSTEEVSIEQLADMIIHLTNSTSQKQFIPYEKAYGPNFDDMARRLPSVDKLKNVTNMKPDTPLIETLRTIIEHHKGK